MKCLPGLILLVLPLVAAADVVTPIESVENHVNIRMSADSTSEIVGRLARGEHLPLVSSRGEWHEVEIAGGATGFISADWTIVLDEVPDEDAAVADEAPEETTIEDDAEEVAESIVEVASGDASDVVADTVDDMTAEVDSVAPAVPEADDSAPQVESETELKAPAAATDIDPADESIDSISAAADDKIADTVAATTQIEATPEVEAEAVGTVEQVENLTDGATESESQIGSGASVVAPVESEPAPDGSEFKPDHTRAAVSGPPGLPGIPGPQGPKGEPGPQGPAGAASIEGTVGFLAKFTAPTIGGSSQVFDNGNRVGIGTTEPKQRLEVNGNIQIHEQNSSVAGLMITQSDGETGYIMHNRASTLTIGAGSVDRITIDSDGNVGFGVARPANPIQMASGAHVTAGGVWTNSSSRTRKENIASLPLEDALDTLAHLEPVSFNYKNDRSENYIGFIAEDVPELVATRDRDGLSAMDIVAVLTRVVQEQQKKIAELEARLDQR